MKRGPRPSLTGLAKELGLIDAEILMRAAARTKEGILDEEERAKPSNRVRRELNLFEVEPTTMVEEVLEEEEVVSTPDVREVDVERDMRVESYVWPRLVYPPMKRNGHVVLDVCEPLGKSISSHHTSHITHPPNQSLIQPHSPHQLSFFYQRHNNPPHYP